MTYDPRVCRATFRDSITGRQFTLSSVTQEQAARFMVRAVELLSDACIESTPGVIGAIERPQ
jgi:hypothetical protein